jgi:hypothetical protein
VSEKKEVDGKMVLKFEYIYLIGVTWPDPDIGVRKLPVDAKTSAKIDAYLREGINVFDIEVLRTPKGIRYKIEPFEYSPSVPGYSTALPISLWKRIEYPGGFTA